MSVVEPEPRSWLPSLNEPNNRTRPRKETRKRAYTNKELSDHVDDLADGFEDIVYFLIALRKVADKTWKFLKMATPVLIGALLASGAVTGPLGEAIKYIAEHWPA